MKSPEKVPPKPNQSSDGHITQLGDALYDANTKKANRRQALRTLGRFGAGIATGNVPRAIRALKDIETEKGPSGQFAETISQAAFEVAAETVAITLLGRLGIKTEQIGNAGEQMLTQRLKKSPIETTIEAAVIMPILEELFFRQLPQYALKKSDERDAAQGKNKSLRMDVGIPLSAIFATGHNFTSKGFSTDYIPLPQFTGALFYWYLIRRRGLNHSILAHVEQNTISVVDRLLTRFP